MEYCICLGSVSIQQPRHAKADGGGESPGQTLVVISSREPKDCLADGGPISYFP